MRRSASGAVPALAEFAGRPFARAEALRLDELRVAARERQAELLLAPGAGRDAVAALQAVVAEHPERERARGLLMQALYQSGRHTDALATFRSWRGTCPRISGSTPHLPWNASSRTSCGMHCRCRTAVPQPPAGRCRCR